MCDYSLMSVPNRLAREGEELVAHRFPTGSIGFASPADLQPPDPQARSFWKAVKEFFDPISSCRIPAVCVPPSARLRLHGIGEDFQRAHRVGPVEEVRFEQLTAAANTYRDAVRFGNGRPVRLQELPVGQAATVLSLGDRTEDIYEPGENLEFAPRAR